VRLVHSFAVVGDRMRLMRRLLQRALALW